jgi:hypothetical protein
MHDIVKYIFVLALWMLANGSVQAQSMYDEELSQLSGILRSLMVRTEKNHPTNEVGRYVIQVELLELSKKLHRLEEEAMRANVELQNNDRQLLLAASISKTLDLAQSLTGHYLVTRDNIFWSSAVGAAQSARTMQAAQQ